MIFIRQGICICIAALLLVAPAAAASPTAGSQKSSKTSRSKHTTSRKTRSSSAKKVASKRSKKSWKHRGQQGIQPERAQQIQEALIRAHYLDGDPSGTWDSRTEEALRRYQADNGWQTKIIPDSRAIIKLGLGPSNEGLINPETAATATTTAATAVDLAPVTPGASHKN